MRRNYEVKSNESEINGISTRTTHWVLSALVGAEGWAAEGVTAALPQPSGTLTSAGPGCDMCCVYFRQLRGT